MNEAQSNNNSIINKNIEEDNSEDLLRPVLKQSVKVVTEPEIKAFQFDYFASDDPTDNKENKPNNIEDNIEYINNNNRELFNYDWLNEEDE